MQLQWILVFISIVIIAMIAWHSSHATLAKVFGFFKSIFKRKAKSSETYSSFELELGSNDFLDEDQDYDMSHDLSAGPDEYDRYDHHDGDNAPEHEPAPENNEDIYVLHLRALHSHGFNGEPLVLQLNRAGLHFGDMDIFHYEQKTPYGTERLFSLASAFEPGVFDMDRIEHFKTNGLTLFMQPSATKNPRAAFEKMLQISERLADALQAEICDQSWQPLNERTIEGYFKRMKEPRRTQMY